MKTTLYGSHRYDKDYLLKLSPILWIVLIYCLRHILIVGISFLPRLQDASVLRDQVEPVMVLCDIPVLILFVAYMRRQPNASSLVRAIWHRGRELISSSVVLHIVLLFITQWSYLSQFRPEAVTSVINYAAIDIAMLLYLWRSGLARDIFADFPMVKAAK